MFNNIVYSYTNILIYNRTLMASSLDHIFKKCTLYKARQTNNPPEKLLTVQLV